MPSDKRNMKKQCISFTKARNSVRIGYHITKGSLWIYFTDLKEKSAGMQ